MLVFALTTAGIGIALTVLSLFLKPSPTPATSAGDPPEPPGAEEGRPPTRAELRWWGLPLAAVGLLATTLISLDRSLEVTLAVAGGVGLPVGLASAWLLHRFR